METQANISIPNPSLTIKGDDLTSTYCGNNEMPLESHLEKVETALLEQEDVLMKQSDISCEREFSTESQSMEKDSMKKQQQENEEAQYKDSKATADEEKSYMEGRLLEKLETPPKSPRRTWPETLQGQGHSLVLEQFSVAEEEPRVVLNNESTYANETRIREEEAKIKHGVESVPADLESKEHERTLQTTSEEAMEGSPIDALVLPSSSSLEMDDTQKAGCNLQKLQESMVHDKTQSERDTGERSMKVEPVASSVQPVNEKGAKETTSLVKGEKENNELEKEIPSNDAVQSAEEDHDGLSTSVVKDHISLECTGNPPVKDHSYSAADESKTMVEPLPQMKEKIPNMEVRWECAVQTQRGSGSSQKSVTQDVDIGEKQTRLEEAGGDPGTSKDYCTSSLGIESEQTLDKNEGIEIQIPRKEESDSALVCQTEQMFHGRSDKESEHILIPEVEEDIPPKENLCTEISEEGKVVQRPETRPQNPDISPHETLLEEDHLLGTKGDDLVSTDCGNNDMALKSHLGKVETAPSEQEVVIMEQSGISCERELSTKDQCMEKDSMEKHQQEDEKSEDKNSKAMEDGEKGYMEVKLIERLETPLESPGRSSLETLQGQGHSLVLEQFALAEDEHRIILNNESTCTNETRIGEEKAKIKHGVESVPVDSESKEHERNLQTTSEEAMEGSPIDALVLPANSSAVIDDTQKTGCNLQKLQESMVHNKTESERDTGERSMKVEPMASSVHPVDEIGVKETTSVVKGERANNELEKEISSKDAVQSAEEDHNGLSTLAVRDHISLECIGNSPVKDHSYSAADESKTMIEPLPQMEEKVPNMEEVIWECAVQTQRSSGSSQESVTQDVDIGEKQTRLEEAGDDPGTREDYCTSSLGIESEQTLDKNEGIEIQTPRKQGSDSALMSQTGQIFHGKSYKESEHILIPEVKGDMPPKENLCTETSEEGKVVQKPETQPRNSDTSPRETLPEERHLVLESVSIPQETNIKLSNESAGANEALTSKEEMEIKHEGTANFLDTDKSESTEHEKQSKSITLEHSEVSVLVDQAKVDPEVLVEETCVEQMQQGKASERGSNNKDTAVEEADKEPMEMSATDLQVDQTGGNEVIEQEQATILKPDEVHMVDTGSNIASPHEEYTDRASEISDFYTDKDTVVEELKNITRGRETEVDIRNDSTPQEIMLQIQCSNDAIKEGDQGAEGHDGLSTLAEFDNIGSGCSKIAPEEDDCEDKRKIMINFTALKEGEFPDIRETGLENAVQAQRESDFSAKSDKQDVEVGEKKKILQKVGGEAHLEKAYCSLLEMKSKKPLDPSEQIDIQIPLKEENDSSVESQTEQIFSHTPDKETDQTPSPEAKEDITCVGTSEEGKVIEKHETPQHPQISPLGSIKEVHTRAKEQVSMPEGPSDLMDNQSASADETTDKIEANIKHERVRSVPDTGESESGECEKPLQTILLDGAEQKETEPVKMVRENYKEQGQQENAHTDDSEIPENEKLLQTILPEGADMSVLAEQEEPELVKMVREKYNEQGPQKNAHTEDSEIPEHEKILQTILPERAEMSVLAEQEEPEPVKMVREKYKEQKEQGQQKNAHTEDSESPEHEKLLQTIIREGAEMSVLAEQEEPEPVTMVREKNKEEGQQEDATKKESNDGEMADQATFSSSDHLNETATCTELSIQDKKPVTLPNTDFPGDQSGGFVIKHQEHATAGKVDEQIEELKNMATGGGTEVQNIMDDNMEMDKRQKLLNVGEDTAREKPVPELMNRNSETTSTNDDAKESTVEDYSETVSVLSSKGSFEVQTLETEAQMSGPDESYVALDDTEVKSLTNEVEKECTVSENKKHTSTEILVNIEPEPVLRNKGPSSEAEQQRIQMGDNLEHINEKDHFSGTLPANPANKAVLDFQNDADEAKVCTEEIRKGSPDLDQMQTSPIEDHETIETKSNKNSLVDGEHTKDHESITEEIPSVERNIASRHNISEKRHSAIVSQTSAARNIAAQEDELEEEKMQMENFVAQCTDNDNTLGALTEYFLQSTLESTDHDGKQARDFQKEKKEITSLESIPVKAKCEDTGLCSSSEMDRTLVKKDAENLPSWKQSNNETIFKESTSVEPNTGYSEGITKKRTITDDYTEETRMQIGTSKVHFKEAGSSIDGTETEFPGEKTNKIPSKRAEVESQNMNLGISVEKDQTDIQDNKEDYTAKEHVEQPNIISEPNSILEGNIKSQDEMMKEKIKMEDIREKMTDVDTGKPMKNNNAMSALPEFSDQNIVEYFRAERKEAYSSEESNTVKIEHKDHDTGKPPDAYESSNEESREKSTTKGHSKDDKSKEASPGMGDMISQDANREEKNILTKDITEKSEGIVFQDHKAEDEKNEPEADSLASPVKDVTEFSANVDQAAEETTLKGEENMRVWIMEDEMEDEDRQPISSTVQHLRNVTEDNESIPKDTNSKEGSSSFIVEEDNKDKKSIKIAYDVGKPTIMTEGEKKDVPVLDHIKEISEVKEALDETILKGNSNKKLAEDGTENIMAEVSTSNQMCEGPADSERATEKTPEENHKDLKEESIKYEREHEDLEANRLTMKDETNATRFDESFEAEQHQVGVSNSSKTATLSNAENQNPQEQETEGTEKRTDVLQRDIAENEVLQATGSIENPVKKDTEEHQMSEMAAPSMSKSPTDKTLDSLKNDQIATESEKDTIELENEGLTFLVKYGTKAVGDYPTFLAEQHSVEVHTVSSSFMHKDEKNKDTTDVAYDIGQATTWTKYEERNVLAEKEVSAEQSDVILDEAKTITEYVQNSKDIESSIDDATEHKMSKELNYNEEPPEKERTMSCVNDDKTMDEVPKQKNLAKHQDLKAESMEDKPQHLDQGLDSSSITYEKNSRDDSLAEKQHSAKVNVVKRGSSFVIIKNEEAKVSRNWNEIRDTAALTRLEVQNTTAKKEATELFENLESDRTDAETIQRDESSQSLVKNDRTECTMYKDPTSTKSEEYHVNQINESFVNAELETKEIPQPKHGTLAVENAPGKVEQENKGLNECDASIPEEGTEGIQYPEARRLENEKEKETATIDIQADNVLRTKNFDEVTKETEEKETLDTDSLDLKATCEAIHEEKQEIPEASCSESGTQNKAEVITSEMPSDDLRIMGKEDSSDPINEEDLFKGIIDEIKDIVISAVPAETEKLHTEEGSMISVAEAQAEFTSTIKEAKSERNDQVQVVSNTAIKSHFSVEEQPSEETQQLGKFDLTSDSMLVMEKQIESLGSDINIKTTEQSPEKANRDMALKQEMITANMSSDQEELVDLCEGSKIEATETEKDGGAIVEKHCIRRDTIDRKDEPSLIKKAEHETPAKCENPINKAVEKGKDDSLNQQAPTTIWKTDTQMEAPCSSNGEQDGDENVEIVIMKAQASTEPEKQDEYQNTRQVAREQHNDNEPRQGVKTININDEIGPEQQVKTQDSSSWANNEDANVNNLEATPETKNSQLSEHSSNVVQTSDETKITKDAVPEEDIQGIKHGNKYPCEDPERTIVLRMEEDKTVTEEKSLTPDQQKEGSIVFPDVSLEANTEERKYRAQSVRNEGEGLKKNLPIISSSHHLGTQGSPGKNSEIFEIRSADEAGKIKSVVIQNHEVEISKGSEEKLRLEPLKSGDLQEVKLESQAQTTHQEHEVTLQNKKETGQKSTISKTDEQQISTKLANQHRQKSSVGCKYLEEENMDSVQIQPIEAGNTDESFPKEINKKCLAEENYPRGIEIQDRKGIENQDKQTENQVTGLEEKEIASVFSGEQMNADCKPESSTRITRRELNGGVGPLLMELSKHNAKDAAHETTAFNNEKEAHLVISKEVSTNNDTEERGEICQMEKTLTEYKEMQLPILQDTAKTAQFQTIQKEDGMNIDQMLLAKDSGISQKTSDLGVHGPQEDQATLSKHDQIKLKASDSIICIDSAESKELKCLSLGGTKETVQCEKFEDSGKEDGESQEEAIEERQGSKEKKEWLKFKPVDAASNMSSYSRQIVQIQDEEDSSTEKERMDSRDIAMTERPEVDEEEGAGEPNTDEPTAPSMAEATKDVDSKPVQKKSPNLLSGVGSKVKHSISKVKKAITGKSSHPKSTSPK